ncbi:MAG: iron-sulfur cluster assembly accessory protein [Anaeromyxobacter sp.]
MTGIEISEQAAAHIRALAAQHGTPEGGLRLGVRGGGCSGLNYVVDWAGAPTASDEVIEREGARVFVDPKSARFLAGTVIEWKKTLLQSGFEFRNPNVKTSCGCGESFSV